MSSSIEVKHWKRNSVLKRLVHAAFPSYHKHTIFVNVSGSVTFQDLSHGDGTQYEYQTVRFKGFEAERDPTWSRPVEGRTIDVLPGYAILQGGRFLGHTSTISIHIHPSDAKLLMNGHSDPAIYAVTITDHHRSITVEG